MLIAQISDLHVIAGAAGDRAAAHAEAALARVAQTAPAPAALVVTGDLTDDGSPEATARVAEILSRAACPVFVIPGNHDERGGLIAAFAPHLTGRFMQQHVRVGDASLVLCDSLVPGSDGGGLSHGRLDEIDALLADAAGRPTILAVHHPPFATGIAGMDEIGLAEADELGALISRHPHVRLVISGHLHRAITGTAGGVPAVVCPGTDRQLVLDLTGETRVRFGDDPPGLVLHWISPAGEIASHLQPL